MSEEVTDIVKSAEAKAIEIVIDFGNIRSPVYLQRFEPKLVEDIFIRLGRPYHRTEIFYHGDGHSGFYDENGHRKGTI